MDKKNITIYDIAKEAKVSPATVSRVISGNAGVSEDKKERVRNAIEKHHFIPNAMAKGLKEQRSRLIGVIVPDIKNPYYASLFYEVQVRALQEGFMVFLCNTYKAIQVELQMIQLLINKQVEALVIIGGALDVKALDESYIKELQAIAKKMPVVITTQTHRLGCIKVVNNDQKCMQLLTAHLAQKGYQSVALIGGSDRFIPSYDRRRYFLECAMENGLVTEKEWMIDGGFDVQSGIQAMEKLWRCTKKPDAVCGINDLIALGILSFSHENHLRVPQDVGVMGCDGIALGATSYPSLSTIATPYAQFGNTIIEAVLLALNDEPYDPLRVIDMELIERKST